MIASPACKVAALGGGAEPKRATSPGHPCPKWSRTAISSATGGDS